MAAAELRGVGIGWRRELAHDLLRRRDAVDFVEVVAETCFVRDRLYAEVRAAAESWPVVLHGVKLSLGSADGIDVEHARRLGRLARELGSPWLTEHVSFTRAGARDIGHLTQLPRRREAVRVVARNVDALRRAVGDLPVALENVAWTARWPDDEMDEATFYQEVVAATGCPLLLDLGNLRANALNEGRDPEAVLDAFPLERVAMVHIAGGAWLDAGGRRFFVDSHAHPVLPEVFALLERLVAARGAVPVILERDANFPPFDELLGELTRARSSLRGAPSRPLPRPGDAPAPPGALGGELVAEQARLAELLTAPAPPESAAPFDAGELGFARDVLRRKRIDDALPLLPRLSAHAVGHRGAAWSAIDAHPRSPRHVALNDAWHIAQAALDEPGLESAAALDALVLSARSVSRAGVMSPRRGPWVGRRALRDGRKAWAFKGVGASSPVRLIVR
ncbi:MAG: DUF692 domain-containing protein [Polyangiales bacterium]